MIYVIDANNLAGKLELLGKDNFDKTLIALVKKYFEGKQIKVILVFDSSDFMGDKRVEDNFEIIYTPRDSMYKCADDKVLEIIVNYLDDKNFKEEIIVVSDDIELKQKIKKEMEESCNGDRVSLVQATYFAKKMFLKEEVHEESEKNDFPEEEVEGLKDELLNKWKNN